MERDLIRAAQRWMPGLNSMTRQEQAYWLSDALGLIYAAPLAAWGLIWLSYQTRLEPIREHWAVFLLALALIAIFRRLDFFLFAEIKTGLYADWGGTFDSIITWSAALVLGPVAFWPGILLHLGHFAAKWREYRYTKMSLPRLRKLALEIANGSLLGMLALTLYEQLGGAYPLPGIQWLAIALASGIAVAWFFLSSLLWAPYFFLTFLPTSAGLPNLERWTAFRTVARLYTVTEILPALLLPFAILAAAMYGEYGFWGYAMLLSGLILPAFLANQLSKAAERGYHRTRELERLERLSTAIIDAPSDASTLPELLQEHVPGMFPDSQVEIRLFPDVVLLRSSQDYPDVPAELWDWLRSWASPEPRYFLRGEARPWSQGPDNSSYLIAPVYSLSSGELIGGVCVVVRWWPNQIIPHFLPAVQSLATLIASTLHQADVTAQMLAGERVAQELALAGEIQAGLLPWELPRLPGWEFAAALEPSRETSGDFYDVILLPSGRLGIAIADVADKGMGAALYMTLSRTLIRSYAVEHEHRPDLVLKAVNQRLMADTQTEMFVTIFYGVLDPQTGRLDYCNAGHNPPYLFSSRRQAGQPEPEMIALKNTGMALGVLEDAPLQRVWTHIEPGSILVLYTDGIPDALNESGEFFELERLIAAILTSPDRTAEGLRRAVLEAVHGFMGEAAQEDDVTLLILVRESAS